MIARVESRTQAGWAPHGVFDRKVKSRAVALRWIYTGALIIAPLIAGCTKPPRVAQVVDGRLLRAGVDTFYWIQDSAGHPDTLSREVQALERATVGKRTVWRQVYQYSNGKGSFTSDSLTMDLRTLLPIVETRHTGDGKEQVRYDATSIRTVLTSQSGSEVHDTIVSGPIYSSSIMDELARAFPEKITERVRMLLFYPFPAEFAIDNADFQNVGSDTVPGQGGRPEACWVVRVDMDDGFTTFWVNKTTREIARIQSGEGSRATIFIR